MAVLRDWKLELNADHILRAQGADPETIRARRPAVVETAEWALQEGRPLLSPVVLYRVLAVAGLRHERLELADGKSGGRPPSLSGRLIAEHMGGAEAVVVMVGTVGPALEEVAAELMPTDAPLGWALDALGSAAVEALSLEACNHFEIQAAQQGWQTGLPLSPGMVGWPVDRGQMEIFSVVDGSEIGVRLTAGSQMVPRKTLSMVLGMGFQVFRGGRTCDYCSLNETCRYQNHYTLDHE